MIEIDLKLLTYDELLIRAKNCTGSSPPLWLECKNDKYSGWAFAAIDWENNLIVQLFGCDIFLILEKHDYNINYRVWTWYPGDAAEQYPWEEEK